MALRLDWSGFSGAAGDPTLLRDYIRYCAPLVAYSWLGFAGEFADRWLLQYYGGSAQQGFFALSQQFSSIALLATTSLLNIFWKELAEAQHRAEFERVRELYRRSARSLFFVSAAAACFLIPHSRALLVQLVGASYENAWPALSLMFLYPVFQTLGQLNGAYLYATEDTKTLVTISSAHILVSLPASYFILAPATATVPGLGLGATGLAARWAVLQIITVSVQSWVVARRQGVSSEMGRHFAVLAGLLAAAWVSRLLATAETGWTGANQGIWAIVVSAPLYAVGLGTFVFAFPDQVGVSRRHLDRIWAWTRRPRNSA